MKLFFKKSCSWHVDTHHACVIHALRYTRSHRLVKSFSKAGIKADASSVIILATMKKNHIGFFTKKTFTEHFQITLFLCEFGWVKDMIGKVKTFFL